MKKYGVVFEESQTYDNEILRGYRRADLESRKLLSRYPGENGCHIECEMPKIVPIEVKTSPINE